MPDHTKRFTDRVGDYAKYRPSYPEGLFDDLARVAWNQNSVVADIGAGTGLFTRLLVSRVGRVTAVEPNDAMRLQGLADSATVPNLFWSAGTAEDTGLDAASLDALVSAQAFHWFDRPAVGREWRRILKPKAPVVLVWNERDEEASALQADYEALLNRWCPDYPRVNHKNLSFADIEAFFTPAPVTVFVHRNDQRFDLDGWRGRLRSASYCPRPDQPGYRELMDGLAGLFTRHQQTDGLMSFPYVTKAYVGCLEGKGEVL